MEESKRFTLDDMLEYTAIILIVAAIAIVGNYLNSGCPIGEAFPGMLILLGIAFVGITLSKVVPLPIPSVVYITVLGVLLAMPYSPTSEFVIKHVDKLQMLSLSAPVLAYAGISMGKDWAEFKKIGWRGILVAICVMVGTFVGSAIIAQFILMGQGII